jgi:hypothetical protein
VSVSPARGRCTLTRHLPRFVAAATLTAAMAWVAAAAGSPDPRSELEFFRGIWTIKGHDATYREVCEWLPGRAFVACNAEDRSESPPGHSLSVFGYSDADTQYTYSGFSSSGSQRSLQGSLQDGVWRFHGQSGRAPNWRRWQVTIKPTPEGFHFREEVSDSSGPWRESVVLEYLRLPEDERTSWRARPPQRNLSATNSTRR